MFFLATGFYGRCLAHPSASSSRSLGNPIANTLTTASSKIIIVHTFWIALSHKTLLATTILFKNQFMQQRHECLWHKF
ncbi:MAG: hypothetical protein A3E85_04630 [Gammaproteobacteria bacterium RIFCSPHIGHO2_12_FULL_45_12]|nr:MAG: hypothetical protein A3E85_04630 [Gammaproteobacteria bacterium RIFCSPHIGHO2_12_FULL_45_12]